jgi:hypothetical protein
MLVASSVLVMLPLPSPVLLLPLRVLSGSTLELLLHYSLPGSMLGLFQDLLRWLTLVYLTLLVPMVSDSIFRVI